MLGRKFVCGMSGVSGFSYVEDIARIFLGCSRATVEGAPCYNIRGEVTSAEEYMNAGAWHALERRPGGVWRGWGINFEPLPPLCCTTVFEVLPAAKDLITIDGKEIPIMADVDESGLVALLKTVPAPHDLKVRHCGCAPVVSSRDVFHSFSLPPFFYLQEPFPTPLKESVKRMADLFTKLKEEGRLHDRDLQ